MRAGSLAIGALIGGVIGASVAILFAPESGEKLREQLRDYAGSVQNQITEAANTRRAQLREQLSQLRSANPPQP